MSHVFISYSTQNSQYANQLAARLRQEGFDVWIDNSKLRSSDNWWESIVRALRGCSAFIVVMTPEAKASKWVQREVTLADNWQKPTFPILLSGDNWEIYVLTQFEKATQGNLPGPDFYEKLAEYAPRKTQPGIDIVRQTGTQPIVPNSDDDDDEIRNEIASPPPVENGPVRSTQQPSLSKTIAVNPAAADTPAISKTIAVNTPSRFNRVAIAGLVGVVVVLVALVALLSRPNPLQDQVNTLAVSTATMQQQIVDLSGQLTEQTLATPTSQAAATDDLDTPATTITRNADWTPQFQTFDGVEMALVPAGCFDMGSNLSGSESRPVNQQCFDAPFWIDVTEVTNSQFASFDGVAANEGTWNEPDQPRENITWFEARDFCDKRSARLPTEREWEYATRGPDNLLYPWGNNFVAENVVGPTNSRSQTSAVGTRAAGSSWVGALDLSGNVEEWVSTKFDQGRFPYPYMGEDGREDPDTNLNSPRVVRGGSWNDVASFMTAVLREGYSPTDHFDSFGFRCARDF